MEVRSYLKDNIDYKTINQWAKLHKTPINDTTGTEMFCNGYRQTKAIYFKPEQVRDMTKEEYKEYRKVYTDKEKEYRVRREKENKRAREEFIEEIKKDYYYKCGEKFAEMLIETANKLPIIPCEKNNKIIVFDTETTGLDEYRDELLQLSAVNLQGEILIDTYIKPYKYESINNLRASAINGIKDKDIEKAPYIHEILPEIKGIFESAKTIVAYNSDFDIGFLKNLGINLEGILISDVMLDFAEIFGDWSEYYESYKWQPLRVCANYYGYKEFDAHNSLNDTLATLYCYKKMKNIK